MEKIVIIGSGPAGHTAAIYTARANLSPVMFEGVFTGGTAGGQLTTTTEIENFPGFPDDMSGPELMERMKKQSIKQQTKIISEDVSSVKAVDSHFEVIGTSTTLETKALIIATGATARRMGIPAEETLWNRGISACAVCDGALPIFRNKELLVVGGGDSAIEEASHLTNFASKVYIVHRRDELRASKAMQKRALEHPKIEILWSTTLVDAKGEMKVEKAVLRNVKTDETYEKEIAGIFYGIGHTPNVAFLDGLLKTDADGYVVTTPGSTNTSVNGIFACGDVQDKHYRQAITAAGSGCMAALDAQKYLEEMKG